MTHKKTGCNPLELQEYRWDVFIAHDADSFRPLGLTYELFNRINPRDFPDKMQHGVRIMVDSNFSIADQESGQLTATSVFEPSTDPDALDNLSVWSGSGTRVDEREYLYYTGIAKSDLAEAENPSDPRSLGVVPQRMFGAVSSDGGKQWKRLPKAPLVDLDSPDNLWYERSAQDNAVAGIVSVNSACRDPFVYRATEANNLFADDASEIAKGKYYMLFTARVNSENEPTGITNLHYRGCVGVAWAYSPEGPFILQEPILNLGIFSYMELPYLVMKNDRVYLFFSVQDHCIDGRASTDVHFAKSIGIEPDKRRLYGYVFEPNFSKWVPMNDRGGLIDSPQGVYGIRVFQQPDAPNKYGARGFFLPSNCERTDGFVDFSLTPLLRVEWNDDGTIRITL
ncbi:MAG: hypothetical protein P8Y45_10710 [Exilibacterium sp.]